MFDPSLMGGAAAPTPAPAPEPVDPAVEEIIRKFLADLSAATQSDGTVTETEKLLLEKARSLSQQFLAGREKEDQAALGGGGALNSVARALGGR